MSILYLLSQLLDHRLDYAYFFLGTQRVYNRQGLYLFCIVNNMMPKYHAYDLDLEIKNNLLEYLYLKKYFDY